MGCELSREIMKKLQTPQKLGIISRKTGVLGSLWVQHMAVYRKE
jgi:hypothetical protein